MPHVARFTQNSVSYKPERQSISKRSENAITPRWLAVHHTRGGGTLSEGRGNGCHSTLPRNSAAVLAARALVPNSLDDGVGAFEHKARTLGEAAVDCCCMSPRAEPRRVRARPPELSPPY